MAVKKEVGFESFSEIAKRFQEEENRKKQMQKTRTSNDQKKKPIKDKEKINKIPRKLSKAKESNSKYDTIAQRQALKQTKKIQKKESKKIPKKEVRRIANISKQIERNVARQTRFTEPKKRNLLSRIILQYQLTRGDFDELEFDYDYITQEEINESKNATKRADKRFYKEVQKYEDAKDDVKVRNGWKAFKIGLAASMLAGSLALANHVGNQVEKTFTSQPDNKIVALETMDIEDRLYYEGRAEEFIEDVREKDGYEFTNLNLEQIADGYYRIYNREKKMIENNFRAAFTTSEDQELLDKIVSEAFEQEYETFSEGEKRDYRQIAFELLPISLPKIFGDTSMYIRNPIVYDVLQARNNARDKGYRIGMIVNSDRPETVKDMGKLLYFGNTLSEEEYQSIDSVEKSGKFLDEMVKTVLGDRYETMSKRDLRDYKQIAYELLPEDAKDTYVKDPIELDKMNDWVIGE